MTRSRAEARRAEEADETDSNESAESREHRGFVRYINTANARIIRPQDLWEIGFSRDADLPLLVWDADTQWCVKRSDIPDDVYDRAIAPDNDFILVEPED
jgi:hypothetical protein